MLDPENGARRTARAVRRMVSSPRRVWERALPGELEFWRRYIETRGLDFPDEFDAQLDPQAPIRDEFLLAAVDLVGGPLVRILDVGAGPLSAVGQRDPRDPDRRVELVAVDPLGDEYAKLLLEAGISPPVLTRACSGEDLVDALGRGSFDIAYARNSVDHGVDAPAIVENMLDCVRVGGAVVLHHYRREAENMRYEELHQWNFDVRDERLVLFDRRHSHDLTERFAGRAETTAVIHAGAHHASWVAATIVRRR